MEAKKDIRNRMIKMRNQLEPKTWWEMSLRITDKLITHPFFLKATEIYCYVDYKQEVSTKLIIETAWKMKKKVAVPKIVGDSMEFFYIHSFSDLQPGFCSIPEPITMQKAIGSKALVIMPGVAFDIKRNRIGYGKGYYDSYLQKHPNFQTIAIAFSNQVLRCIPHQTHDIKPQFLITEDKIYV